MKCEENEGAARPVSHAESRLQQLSQKEESRDEAGWIPQAPDTNPEKENEKGQRCYFWYLPHNSSCVVSPRHLWYHNHGLLIHGWSTSQRHQLTGSRKEGSRLHFADDTELMGNRAVFGLTAAPSLTSQALGDGGRGAFVL